MKKTLIAIALAMLTGFCARPQESATTNQTSAFTDTTTASSGIDRPFGAGVLFGEPTGLSLKYWFTDTMAIDGAAGWSFHDETDFYLHADILWHVFDLWEVPGGRMPLYFGVGPRLKLQDNGDDRFGVRAPVGVSYMFDNAPVDIFLEVAPILDFTPDSRGGFTAGIGVRYWF